MEQTDRYELLLQAIEFERKHEEEFFKQAQSSKSLKERTALGFAWSPVKFISQDQAIGDFVEIELEKIATVDIPHKFREGVGVMLVFTRKSETATIYGTVAFIRKSKMKVLCQGEAVDELELSMGSLSAVELIYDEKPYQVMRQSLSKVMAAKAGQVKFFREGIRSLDSFAANQGQRLFFDHETLNEVQKLALRSSVSASHFAIIHGPPGTGKTTTIIALLKELVASRQKVLVCTSSNNAADLLARLADRSGLRTLRLGNISRIGDDISHLCLDAQVRSFKDWSLIRKTRIQAEEKRKQATRFKRSFGSEERLERKELYTEVRELLSYARQLETEITSGILQSTQIVVTTLISSASDILNAINFDTLIIDEASQASEPECWTAMLRANKIVLVGDHKQLPPTVKSKQAINLGLDKTILDRMAEVCSHATMLRVQYRMNNAILGFPNHQFYKGNLMAAETVAVRMLENDESPLLFIDTAGTGFEEVRNEQSASLCNPGEYNVIRQHMIKHADLISQQAVGIIAPYAEQVRFISANIREDDTFANWQIEVDTIDGFQGQEKDVIYISLVRSNDVFEIGFLEDVRRLNVALTRAKFKLVVVGDSATIGKNNVYAAMMDYMEKHGVLQSAWEYIYQ
ncbi:MAG: IGHMBP2 family helicase [Saprospiraceae bacterium]|nr:IGHMBP2 family helicase [Saprospiraceae bacterium]